MTIGVGMGVLSGVGRTGVSTTFVLTCTTTGAQTLTISQLGVVAGKTVTVTWGDGTSNAYTGALTRTHAYAGAGTWTITFQNKNDISTLSISDSKIGGTIDAGNILPQGLTQLALYGTTGLTWVVGPSSPMPPNLTYLNLYNLDITWTINATNPMPSNLTYLQLQDSGITWTINAANPIPSGITILHLRAGTNLTWIVADAPLPAGLTNLDLYNISGITWTVGPSTPMPTGLTSIILSIDAGSFNWTIGPSAPMPAGVTFLELTYTTAIRLSWTANASNPLPAGLVNLRVNTCPGITIASDQWTRNGLQLVQYNNALNQAAVDAVLLAIWANKANYTYSAPVLTLLGSSNAAPSGVYQSMNPPTTGNEAKYDLINDVPTPGPAWAVTTA